MKRISLLLLSLGLAAHALAMDPAMPAAPDPAAASPASIDLRGLSMALLMGDQNKDFSLCAPSSRYHDDLLGVIRDDIRGFSVGAEALVADSKRFTPEDRAAAAPLAGFIPGAREDLDKDAAAAHQALVGVFQQMMVAAKDPAQVDALRREATAIRARLEAGQVKPSEDDLYTACLGGALLLAGNGRGPLVDRYRAYLQEQTLSYVGYRSPEGYLAARWGMTPAEVAKAEGLPQAALLAGKLVRIDGSPAKATYQFTEGRLSEVVVTFTPGCKPAACLNRFRTVNHLLVQKYGAGEDSSTTDDKALRETASMLFEGLGRERSPWLLIDHGYRKEEHGWQTEESLVVHQLYSRKKPLQKGPSDLVHSIRYLSKKFLPRADYLRRQQEEKAKKKRLENL